MEPLSGAVAERLGRGLQSLVHRFESGPRLFLPPIRSLFLNVTKRLRAIAVVRPRHPRVAATVGSKEVRTASQASSDATTPRATSLSSGFSSSPVVTA